MERIERLAEEKQALADDIAEVYSEAKGSGFDTKTIREVVRLRKLDSAERQERAAMLDLYMSSLGMLAGTPLGQAAIAQQIEEGANKAKRKKVKEPA